jgi:hypothetical protein
LTFDNNNLDTDGDELIEKYKRKLLEDQAKDFVNNGAKLKNNKKNNNSKKTSLLEQLHPNIKEQLSSHIWEIISYYPFKFLIAHSSYKQIIYATVKKESKNLTGIDGIECGLKETVYSLNLSRIVIGAIPVEVILNKNPLGLFDQKYTIEFETQSNDSFTIGPMTLDEIVTCLKDKSLIYMSTKATEVLAVMINAFKTDGQLIMKNDVDTPGFYFIEGQIKKHYQNTKNNNDAHPKPTHDQNKKCCEVLDILQPKFKNKDVFPTLIKWSIVAPFNYILKQVHKKWMQWLYPYGWSNTGKSTIGDMSCCICNRYEDKDSILSFTAADTKARLGEALSRSTYPIVINEVAQLNDENRNRDRVEMIKTAITDTIARKKFVNGSYTDIPSFSPCILTSNSSPPSDTGFRRRIIPIVFTEKDQYSEGEMKDFKELFDQRVKHELRYLGDFSVNYIIEHQDLLLDGKKDWKEIAEIILTEMYKSVEKEPPEWIKYFVNENQMTDSKEDVELLFRSFLIDKVNETYNKYYRNIEKPIITNSDSTAEVPNLPFSDRLNFCLKNNLIPFLNSIKINDQTDMIAITSDLINEIKKKIPQVSSLNEVASIIDGFIYGQKRINEKNIRIAYGTKKQLLDFLWME